MECKVNFYFSLAAVYGEISKIYYYYYYYYLAGPRKPNIT